MGDKEGSYILSKQPNKEPTDVIIYTHTQQVVHILRLLLLGNKFLKKTNILVKSYLRKCLKKKLKLLKKTGRTVNLNTEQRIVFKYNDVFKKLIETQFSNTDDMCFIENDPTNDRWDIIFGATSSFTEIILNFFGRDLPNLNIKKYDYFSGSDSEFSSWKIG